MGTIHPKVSASAFATAFVMALVSILNAVQTNPSLLGGLPTWLQSAILIVVPTALVFLAGYQTPGPRSDAL